MNFPFEDPWEVYLLGAWWNVYSSVKCGDGYLISIEGFDKHDSVKFSASQLRSHARPRSKKAEVSDCRKLKQEHDIAILQKVQQSRKALYDGKIIHKEVTNHNNYLCSCKFVVKLYSCLGKKNLQDEVLEVKIEEIYIPEISSKEKTSRCVEQNDERLRLNNIAGVMTRSTSACVRTRSTTAGVRTTTKWDDQNIYHGSNSKVIVSVVGVTHKDQNKKSCKDSFTKGSWNVNSNNDEDECSDRSVRNPYGETSVKNNQQANVEDDAFSVCGEYPRAQHGAKTPASSNALPCKKCEKLDHDISNRRGGGSNIVPYNPEKAVIPRRHDTPNVTRGSKHNMTDCVSEMVHNKPNVSRHNRIEKHGQSEMAENMRSDNTPNVNGKRPPSGGQGSYQRRQSKRMKFSSAQDSRVGDQPNLPWIRTNSADRRNAKRGRPPLSEQGRTRGDSTRKPKDKLELDLLFDKILKGIQNLYTTSITATYPVDILTEPDQVPWDPIIFHEDNTGKCPQNDEECQDPMKDLWHEMEEALCLDKSKQNAEANSALCIHRLEYFENEGYICVLCGEVVQSIENIFPQVMENKPRNHDGGRYTEDLDLSNDIQQPIMLRKLNIGSIESIWSHIPDLKLIMREHQIDGFKFLWTSMFNGSNTIGGCILAHAPGTGKSLLIISFIKSFMHMNSWSRTIIVAPKNMLLQWEKEFKKWRSGIQVFILNSQNSTYKHLSIISEWQTKPSVLIVGYTLLSKLTIDKNVEIQSAESRKIGKCLLYIPDILILDEGHVPRNQKAQLSKAVLKFRTRARILVSGTLFQNNVNELFSTLHLARPNFIESLIEASGKVFAENAEKGLQTFDEFEIQTSETEEQMAKLAKKKFMDEIGNKLQSDDTDEFRAGANKLKDLTGSFVHHHEGEILKTLPGLREFVVILDATPLQKSLITEMKEAKGNYESLRNVINIHPTLLLDYGHHPSHLASISLDKLEELRTDPLQGMKVNFALEMAKCCQKSKEKILIFSQYLQPLNFMENILKKRIKVSVITGSHSIDERQEIIDRFNDSKDDIQVLLASLTACGEGINLTGASRIIFLDMHWNHARMKQATSRAFRMGQKNVVYTYWLLLPVDMEMDKLNKIQTKDKLSRSIFMSVEESKALIVKEGTGADRINEDEMLDEVAKKCKIVKVCDYSPFQGCKIDNDKIVKVCDDNHIQACEIDHDIDGDNL